MNDSHITLEDVVRDEEIIALIEGARRMMEALRYTDHSKRHTRLIAERAGYILAALDYEPRLVERARIAGYLHDVGNALARGGHQATGAVLAYQALQRLGMSTPDAIEVAAAIANHDERDGQPINVLTAAVILSDKSDVHRSRVQNLEGIDAFDIHDRVNYAVTDSRLIVEREQRMVRLELEVDTEISSVSDYFEIFLSRMLMCRHAAIYLGLSFSLVINGNKLM